MCVCVCVFSQEIFAAIVSNGNRFVTFCMPPCLPKRDSLKGLTSNGSNLLLQEQIISIRS